MFDRPIDWTSDEQSQHSSQDYQSTQKQLFIGKFKTFGAFGFGFRIFKICHDFPWILNPIVPI
jgi:hypothetical protein